MMSTYRAEPTGWRSLADASFISTEPPPETVVLIDAATPTGVQPDGQTSGWVIDFSDEFAGTAVETAKWDPWYPDTSFWNVTTPGGHKTNTNEPQSYDPSAWSIGDSAIKFTMRNEELIAGLPYTSGMISSWPSYATAYGYFEARIKLPVVQGSWPAFWMYPHNHSWPPEIDIMESWGGTVVGQNYHSPNDLPKTGTGTGTTVINAGQFNTYGILWDVGLLVWYVNGVEVLRFEEPTITNTPMIIFCNLAGDKDGPPAAGNLPMTMEVDYIRAWKAAV